MKCVLCYHADLQKWQFHTIQPKNADSAKIHKPSSFLGSAETKGQASEHEKPTSLPSLSPTAAHTDVSSSL